MKEIEALLNEKKTDLEKRLKNIARHAGQKLDPDSSERALEIENDEVMQKLDEEASIELAQINEALHKIKKGNFGVCVECHEKIPLARLKAAPFSSRCINCAT